MYKVFENYQRLYQNIFNSFYPSLGSTGFQERNLTVNFSKAYEETNKSDNVFSWFELQFGNNKDNHYDCVIVNISKKAIFFIESKRYVNTSSKKESVMKDIDRIQNFVKSGLDERFERFKDFKINGLILADAWWRDTKRNKKKVIRDSYKNGTLEFNANGPHKSDAFDFTIDGCKENYSLLYYLWEIKE